MSLQHPQREMSMQGKQAKIVSPTQERAILGSLATTRAPHRDRGLWLVSMQAGLRASAPAARQFCKPAAGHRPAATGARASTLPGG